MKLTLPFCLILDICVTVLGHVVLTFPPARPIAFDYLDNRQSDPPCGVPFNEEHNLMTSVVSGRKFNITWHVAYPHQGGFKLQLLDLSGNITEELTNSEFIYQNDSTKLFHDVIINSETTCDHCVLRILRQAKDWSRNGSDEYLFWSCADISVLSETEVSETTNCYDGICLNGGSCENGVCDCMPRFKGERCEYENDCDDDSYCNSHGACLETGSISYPQKACFCESGWTGRLCGIMSRLADPKLKKSDEKKFHKIELYKEPEFSMFWRIIGDDKDEIEIALRVKTDTWCAIGWRPTDVDASCKKFPLNTMPEPGADSVAEERDEVLEEEELNEAEDQKAVDEERKDTEIPKEEEDVVEAKEYRKRRAAVEKLNNDKINVIEELCNAGNTTAAADWARKSFALDPAGEIEENTDTNEEENITPEPEPTPEPAPEPTPESNPEPSSSGDTTREDSTLHPMDCMDITYVAAKGRLQQVLDYYTRDRSTPHHDSWYGGTEDIVAAVARNENGIMHVRFIRKLVTRDKSDQPLLDQSTRLIWARGQTPLRFYHKPFSGLETCEASDYGYYKINELMYHGTKPSQRGSIIYNFYDDPDEEETPVAEGSFSHPEDCGNQCEYIATWRYRKSTDQVHFFVEANVNESQWAGIGFSQNTAMEDSDAVVGWVETSTGELTLTDMWLASKTSEGVALDNGPSSLINPRGWYIDGKLKFSFSRKRDTGDDNDLALTECVYLLGAWGGQITNGDLGKHTKSAVSGKICIGSNSSRFHVSFWCTACTIIVTIFTVHIN